MFSSRASWPPTTQRRGWIYASEMKGRKSCPLASRIKKLMQLDEDVGKISQATPILIGGRVFVMFFPLVSQAGHPSTAKIIRQLY